MRLSRNSNLPTLFKAPGDSAKPLAFMEFTVTPSGHTWLLEQVSDGGYEAFGYKPDEDTPDDVSLQVPKHVDIRDFAVSEDGTELLGGYYDGSAGKELGGKPYLALFDRSGRVRRDLSSEGLRSVDLKQISKQLHDGATTVGPDGNFYLVTGSELLIVSGGGDIVRRLVIPKTEEELAVSSIAVTEGLISVQLTKGDKEGMLHVQYLVLNAGTGEPYSLYTPSDELGNNCVCFERNAGYTFLRVEKGKLKFLTAPLT